MGLAVGDYLCERQRAFVWLPLAGIAVGDDLHGVDAAHGIVGLNFYCRGRLFMQRGAAGRRGAVEQQCARERWRIDPSWVAEADVDRVLAVVLVELPAL